MGLFSWNCKVCDRPILVLQATNAINRWMSQAVAIDKNSLFSIGFYDGYGRVGGKKILCSHDDKKIPYSHDDNKSTQNSDRNVLNGDPAMYHTACWVEHGQPLDYTSPSSVAKNQGYFFEEGEYDIEIPSSIMKKYIDNEKNNED